MLSIESNGTPAKKKKMRMKAARRSCSKGKLTHQLIFVYILFSGQMGEGKVVPTDKRVAISPLF
jgi:hypothetical protein